MKGTITNARVQVSQHDDGASALIIVSGDQLAEVRALLRRLRVSHHVSKESPGITGLSAVHLSPDTDVARVQRALDEVQ